MASVSPEVTKVCRKRWWARFVLTLGSIAVANCATSPTRRAETSEDVVDRLREVHGDTAAFEEAEIAYDKSDRARGDMIRQDVFCSNAAVLKQGGDDPKAADALSAACDFLAKYARRAVAPRPVVTPTELPPKARPKFGPAQKRTLALNGSTSSLAKAFPSSSAFLKAGDFFVYRYEFSERTVDVIQSDDAVLGFISSLRPPLDLGQDRRLAVILECSAETVGDLDVFERPTDDGKSFYALGQRRMLAVDAAESVMVLNVVKTAVERVAAGHQSLGEIWGEDTGEDP